MATLKKYDLKGKEQGEVAISDDLIKSANSQMIKDYIVAIRKNARQWSAHTKTRAEVSVTKKKPRPQKGLGGSRQGSFAAPHYRGGGVAFGPRAKHDMHVRINRKERRLAVASILGDRVRSGNVHILDLPEMKEPKTKVINDFLKEMKFSKGRVLFLGPNSDGQENQNNHFIKSMRNIPKVEFMQNALINGYDLMVARDVVILGHGFDELVAILSK